MTYCFPSPDGCAGLFLLHLAEVSVALLMEIKAMEDQRHISKVRLQVYFSSLDFMKLSY
jgi:hypothetical protein